MAKHTRHDRFFHEMMRFASFRRAFVRHHVPFEILALLQLNRLQAVPESFKRAHKTIVPDLVLRAPLKHAVGWGYLVLEQETNPKKDMPVRMAIAKGRILEHDLQDHQSQVPPLIWCIVFCNGRRKWPHDLDLYADLPASERELIRRSLGAPPQLLHVNDLTESVVESCPELTAAHVLFKRAYDDPVEVLADLEPVLAAVLRRKNGEAVLQAIIDYIFPGDGQEQVEEFILKLESVLRRRDVRRVIMSFSDIFRQEGKQLGLREGLEKGLEKGKLETARNMLRKGMSVTTIAEVTGLPRQKLAALRKKK